MPDCQNHIRLIAFNGSKLFVCGTGAYNPTTYLLDVSLTFLLLIKMLGCFCSLAGAVEYTDCFSAEGYDPPPHTHTNECPRYDTKQSRGEVPVKLELWGMWTIPSLPSTPGPLWS